jgi:uncharacterized protein (TIGR02099 family)
MPTLIKRILHYAVYAVAAVVIAISGMALYLRIVIMPDVDRYKADIEGLAGKAIGMPLRIGAVEADWWGLNPRFSLRNVRLVQAGAEAPLSLSRVDATLSWLSLFDWDVRLASLALYEPEVEVRRDTHGVVYVADIPVNTPGPRSPLPDWLLRQRHIMVSNGSLVWRDEMVGAPPLVLGKVNLILRNRRDHHQLGVTAKPPVDSIRDLDVRIDAHGDSVRHPENWQGRVYARANAVSVEALHRWAPWAQEQVRQGTGDARIWLDVKSGQVSGLTGDVRLRDVAVSLAKDYPDMRFRDIEGRMGWSRNRDTHTLMAHGLSFTTQEGEHVAPTNVSIQTHLMPDGSLTLTGARADNLRIEALTALSGAIPMPRPMHDWLGAHRPRGYIEGAELQWENARKYRLSARFRDAGILPDERLPGFAGLDGRIVATGSGGEAQFSSKGLDLRLDKVFRYPLRFDQFDTDLAWEAWEGGKMRLRVGTLRVSNADVDATAQGVVELAPNASPVLDIQAHATRGQGNAVWRYLPKQVSEHASEWLHHSLVGGVSPDTRLILKGPVDKFPYDKGGGDFSVVIQARDARLRYAPGWPDIQDINGQVVFRGVGMYIDVPSAKSSGVDLGPVKAVIPDLHGNEHEVLRIEGKATGATPAFLEFIRQSPVFDHTGRFTERLKAQGQGVLNLRLNLPLRNLGDTTVRGDYRMTDNSIEPGEDLPLLSQVNGTLSFTENLLRGDDIATRVFGQPAALRVASETGGRVKVALNGRVGVEALKAWLPKGVDRYLAGTTAYESEVSLKAQQTTIKIKSDLVGIESRLPAPLAKSTDQTMPLQVSTSEGQGGAHITSLQYGQVLSGRMVTKSGEEPRALLYLGGASAASLPRDTGLVIMGSLRRLDLDAWDDIEVAWSGASTGTGGAGLELKQASVNIAELRAMDRDFHDMRIRATPAQRGWHLEMQGREMVGDVVYAEAGGLPGKRFSGHFQRLAIPTLTRTSGAAAPDRGDPVELPRIVDINVQSLAIGDREIGQLNTMMEAERTGLRTRNLVINNPDGRLQGSGWVSASHRQVTEFDINLDSPGAGKLLNRLGVTEGIKGAPATLEGNINWLGRPEDFEIGNLGGQLKLKMKAGRFTQLDPGAGRLLGILSLQALPRRIVLDFRDVFSEGFSFDSIEGDIHLARGVAYLPDLLIRGPSAIVHMKGQIDLAKETQDLRVTIQPRLDDSLAVAGALLGGPAVGVGTLVATKLLQNPMSKAATFEYLIKGTWSDPQVTKLARPKPQATESPLTP